MDIGDAQVILYDVQTTSVKTQGPAVVREAAGVFMRPFRYCFIDVLVISALHSCCFTVNFNIWQGDIQGEHWVKCSLGQRSPTRRSPWALWAPAQQEAVGILSWHLDVGFLVALWDCHGWGRAISFSILFPSTLGDPMTLFWKVNKVFLESLCTQTGLGRSAAGGSEMDW